MTVLWGMRASLCYQIWMLKNSCPDFMIEAPYTSFHCPFFPMQKKTWCSDRREQVQSQAGANLVRRLYLDK